MLLQARLDSVEVLVTVATATPAEAVAAQKKLKTAITDNVYPSRLTAAGVHQLPCVSNCSDSPVVLALAAGASADGPKRMVQGVLDAQCKVSVTIETP